MSRKKKEQAAVALPKKKARALDLDRERFTANMAGEPTYRFSVGDRVTVGNLKEATVDEILDDGKIYGISFKGLSQEKGQYDGHNYFPWTGVRPITAVPEMKFTRNDKIRLHFTNRTVGSLLHMHLGFGVDFEPDYQRGRVWDEKDQEMLLDSIFLGADIGKFVFRHRSAEEWRKDELSYEIVDGKQRLLTLLDFYENRFPYRDLYFNDLHPDDKRTFKETTVAVAEIDCNDKEQILKVFLTLNRGGRPVSDEVIQRAEHLLRGDHLYKATVTISDDDGEVASYSQELFDLAAAKNIRDILRTFAEERGFLGVEYTVNLSVVDDNEEYVDSDEATFRCWTDENGRPIMESFC